MDQQWQQWVEVQGGALDDEGLLRVGDEAAQLAAIASEQGFAPLTEWALIRLQGEDALTFLQGQLSSDLSEVSPTHSQYSTYSTAKGRMQANFLVWQYQGAYYLMLRQDLSATLHKRLSMFILRSKVKAELVTKEWTLLGLLGSKAESVASKYFNAAPVVPHQVEAGNDGVLLRLPSGALLWAKAGEGKGLADELLAEVPLIGSEPWRLLDIRAGIPWLGKETSEAFVAQMANMELIGAVSFKKGCYPGQEIVARTQYLGKLKRRLYRVSVPGPVTSGDELMSPAMGDQAIGMVVNVVQTESDRWEALAVVQSNCWESGVFVKAKPELALQQLNLPYPLESESALQ
jgi:folate-binding protein YgfZ